MDHPRRPSPSRARRWPALAAAVLGALAATGVAAGELDPFARFHPVRAERHMVVAQDAEAARIGLEVLRAGGNAVDAAVAVGFALAVAMPQAGNLGGGGFMIVHMERGEEDETVAIDYRETAPGAAARDMFLDAEGTVSPVLSRSTGLSVGVPGTVAGLVLAHERYGSGRFTLAELVRPAVELARGGVAVSPMLADALRSEFLRDRLLQDEAAAALFYPGGEALSAGETLRAPDLAAALERIAEEGPAGFYEGPTAEAIVATVTARGGRMALADLAAYAPVVREPLRGEFKGYEVVSMPPPSSGGVHLLQMLNILEPAHFGTWGVNGAEMIHMMAEAARRAYADRAVYLGDPGFVEVPVEALTSREYADALRSGIDMMRATPSTEIRADPGLLPPESNETTHFSILDGDGNAVANTTTLNFSFGVGFMAEGTGIFLNNQLADFSAAPGVPDRHGVPGAEANAVEPRKRPLSSMTPTILLKDGKVALVTGSPGGSRIITTVMQIILNATVHYRDIATATALPRVHHEWLPDYIRIERGISHDTIRLLEEKGHQVRVEPAMGAAQSIRVGSDGTIYGATDMRQPGGLAAGD